MHLGLPHVRYNNEFVIFCDSNESAGLNDYANTKDVFYLRKAADRMSGFINHYARIPGMAHDEVPALKRWCKNRWRTIAGKKLFFDQTWFLLRDRQVN